MSTSRKLWLGPLLAAVTVASTPGAAQQKPNIVVIMGDDALTCAWIRSSAGHSQKQDMRL
jgi:hypothetical protein